MLKPWLTLLFLASVVGGCASMQDVDRSYLNHQAMDLRSANNLGEPCPSTGLRHMKKTLGGETCTVCAH